MTDPNEEIREQYKGGFQPLIERELTARHAAPEITPNVVIQNSNVRLWIGIALYVLLFLIGTASLALAFFPEIEFGNDMLARLIAFGTAFITYAASVFGIAVTTPNIPRR